MKNCEQHWLEKKGLHLQGKLFGVRHKSDSSLLQCRCLHEVPSNQEMGRKDNLKRMRWTIFFLSDCCCCVGRVSDCLTQQSVRMKFISIWAFFHILGSYLHLLRLIDLTASSCSHQGAITDKPWEGLKQYSPQKVKSVHHRAVTHSSLVTVLSPCWCKPAQCHCLYLSSTNLHHLQSWLLILATHLSSVLPVTAVDPQLFLNPLCSFRVFLGALIFLLKCFCFFCSCAIDPQL